MARTVGGVSTDILPTGSVEDIPDVFVPDARSFGYFSYVTPEVTRENEPDSLGGEPGEVVLLSHQMPLFSDHIANVFELGTNLKMCRVATRRIVTRVHDYLAFRDALPGEQKENNVSGSLSKETTSSYTYYPVSMFVPCADPRPALGVTATVDIGEYLLYNRVVHGILSPLDRGPGDDNRAGPTSRSVS